MLEITAQIGPFKTSTAVVNGKVVAIVKRVRNEQWLLIDRTGCSFDSILIKNAKTSCKGFGSKAQAIKFIKNYYK